MMNIRLDNVELTDVCANIITNEGTVQLFCNDQSYEFGTKDNIHVSIAINCTDNETKEMDILNKRYYSVLNDLCIITCKKQEIEEDYTKLKDNFNKLKRNYIGLCKAIMYNKQL